MALNQRDRRYLRELLERDVDWMHDYAQSRNGALAWARRIDRVAAAHGIRLPGGPARRLAESDWPRKRRRK